MIHFSYRFENCKNKIMQKSETLFFICDAAEYDVAFATTTTTKWPISETAKVNKQCCH